MEPSQLPYRISSLIIKELEETISDAEKQELTDWINASPTNRDLFNQLTNPEYLQEAMRSLQNFDKEKGKQQVFERIGQSKKVPKLFSLNHWIRYAAAAVFLAAIGLAIYLNTNKETTTASVTDIARQQPDSLILPGTDKAVLTLSDGRSIVLDSAQGTIKNELNLSVNNETGKIAYLPGKLTKELPAPLHKLTTPRGGQ